MFGTLCTFAFTDYRVTECLSMAAIDALTACSPLHALHQGHLVGRGGDVEGGGLALVDAVLDAVHRLLLLHLHRVAQAQGAEEQLLTLLHAEEKNTPV